MLLSSGFVALDVVQSVKGTWLRAGGTAANVAANLAFLGWSSRLAATIGDDDAGHLVQSDLADAGVDVGWLELRAGIGTPLVVHEVRETGHRFKFGCAACGRTYARHTPIGLQRSSGLAEKTSLADIFFFDRPSAAALALAEAHTSAGKLVVYEPSTTSRADAHSRAVHLANVVKYSSERAQNFQSLLPRPRPEQLWIVTQGNRGAKFKFDHRKWRPVSAFSVQTVDAAGSGDWMTAALLHGLPEIRAWNGDLIRGAILRAQAVAALNCLVPGARLLASAIDIQGLERRVSQVMAGHPPDPTDLIADNIDMEGRCPACRLPLAAS